MKKDPYTECLLWTLEMYHAIMADVEPRKGTARKAASRRWADKAEKTLHELRDRLEGN